MLGHFVPPGQALPLSEENIPVCPGRQGRHLQDQKGRHPQAKGPVAGLVAEKAHTQQGAHAPPGQGGQKVNLLRQTPCAVFGLPLVHAHKAEGGHVPAQNPQQYTGATGDTSFRYPVSSPEITRAV